MGVWLLPILAYFNCWPLLLNTKNCRSPSGYQIIFIRKNENEFFVTIWTLSYFSEGGMFVSCIHISAVNCRFWLTASLYTFCWNSANQLLIFAHSYLPWTAPYHNIDRCRGRLSGSEGFWNFRKDKTQPGWRGTSIHTLLFLTFVLIFCRCGIRNTPCQWISGLSSPQSGWSPGKVLWSSWFLRWVFLQIISLTFWFLKFLLKGTY